MALQGERLDKPTYTVIQTMSEVSSSGLCMKAYHDVYERWVVQKTVSLLGLDDAVAFTEPQLLNTIRHEHLVEVWEAQWDPDPKWRSLKAVTFVMPYYEGGSVLDALLEGHRFSLNEAIGIACDVLDALHHLHVERHLLHRDIKPANILLDGRRRTAYLADLGSAAPMSAAADAEVRRGTPLYQPPEGHLGRYDVRGDIYGVGMVLLEMLNSPFPYEDLKRTTVEARLAVGRAPVPARLLRPAPQVPPGLSRLVSRMVSVDPSRRPASALAVQRSLERLPTLDWRERTEDQDRVWEGRWPPAAPVGRGRVYEVRAARVPSGRYAGQLLLTARWRDEGSTTWREYRSLRRRVATDDSRSLAGFFREVEAKAQRSAAA